MQTIYLVLKNLKHDGINYNPGQFISGSDGAFPNLVTDGVLRRMEAENVAGAEAILAKEKEDAGEKEVQEAEKAPENTWGAKPNEPAEDKTTQANTDENSEIPKDAVNVEDKQPGEVGQAVNSEVKPSEDAGKDL